MMVRLTAQAEDELQSIGDYIADTDPARAITFLQELRAKCSSIGELPRGYPLVPRYAALGIRRRAHGNYLIFYRIEPCQIVVIHVLHGARDYETLLIPT